MANVAVGKTYKDPMFYAPTSENFSRKISIPSLETRRVTASAFAANMEVLFSPKASPAALTPTRISQVKPTSDDTLELDTQIQRQIDRLHSICLEDNPLIYGDIPRKLKDSLETTRHDIENTERAMSSLSLEPESLSLKQLTICKELFAIVERNVTVIDGALRRLIYSRERPPAIYFRPDFWSLAYTIASNPVESNRVLQKGSYGIASLVVHENGTSYVVKRQLEDADFLARCSDDLTLSEKEDSLQEQKHKNSLDLATETAINYSLPLDPGIMDFLGVDKHGDPLLSYVPGGELFDAISQDTLTTAQIYKIGKKLAKTLVFLHRNRIIHCDLKPENILLTEKGEPKIIDFGLAKSGFKPTDFKKKIGSRDYMAPEMLRRGQPKDNKIDVWSYGCILYTMLSGDIFYDHLLEAYRKKPLDYTSDRDLNDFLSNSENNIEKGILSIIRNLRLKQTLIIGEQLELVLMSCLKIDPKERGSMEDIMAIFNGSF